MCVMRKVVLLVLNVKADNCAGQIGVLARSVASNKRFLFKLIVLGFYLPYNNVDEIIISGVI